MSKKKQNKSEPGRNSQRNGAPAEKHPQRRSRLLAPVIGMLIVVTVTAIWMSKSSDDITSEVTAKVANQSEEVVTDSSDRSGATTKGPSIHFPESTFDFGSISPGDKVTHSFVVKNTGDEPLKIIRAKGS